MSRVTGRQWIGRALICVGLVFGLSAALSPAEAKHYHAPVRHDARHHLMLRVAHISHPRARLRHSAPSHYASNFAAMVVDANTGRTLYAVNENRELHPASLTKVMTLYLLFEQLKKGGLTLDTRIPISAHAASMPPTKLGLRPGSSITIRNAIKAIVTHSANDIAVAIAEALGGSESNFARIMTEKARALGMTRTHYANASGLPNSQQLTTAHDLIVLARAIEQHFPQYYKYFSTREFRFAGRTMHTFDHLLGRIPGVDGIKTGYTNASGFNILTSVQRGRQHIFAVVLGGRTAASRDRLMANLIAQHFAEASDGRAPLPVAERGSEDRAGPAALAKTARARPAFVSGTLRSTGEDRFMTGSVAVKRSDIEGSTSARLVAGAESPHPISTATPSALRWIVGPRGRPLGSTARSATRPVSKTRLATAEVGTTDIVGAEGARSAPRDAGVMIQIGATDDEEQASALLARARRTGRSILLSARPFTEKVKKGNSTFYRARFAGLDEGHAKAACKALKRSGIACFTTRN